MVWEKGEIMGTWGTGITSSDIFKDIYDDFFQLYNNGNNIELISKELERKYQAVLLDEDESNEYYFALAKAKWECSALDKNLLLKIESIIESGSELKRWERLGASQSDLRKREKVINEFYKKLLTVNLKPRKIKKNNLRDSIFRKGDCLMIDLINGSYGAAIVLSEQAKSEFGLNLILMLDYYSNEIPVFDNFNNGFCLLEESIKKTYEPFIQYCYARFYKKAKYKFIKVASIEIELNYNSQNEMYSYGHWNFLGDYLLHVKTKGKKILDKIKVERYIKK